MLSENELIRYERHIKLNEIGLEGQKCLKSAKVLVVGAGGLGCPVLQYLVAAGVGTIGIVDNDIVSLNNLQRQILYSHQDIGKSKVEMAAKWLSAQNPFVTIYTYATKFDSVNANAISTDYQIIIGATDNFESRYLIDDICQATGKVFVHGSIGEFEGQVAVFNYQGKGSYRKLYPQPSENELSNGVIGALPAIVGSFMAMETLKIITQIGIVLSEKLLLINTLTMDIHKIRI